MKQQSVKIREIRGQPGPIWVIRVFCGKDGRSELGPSVGRWVGGSVGRWVGGSVGRWVGASVHRCIGETTIREDP